MKVPFLKLKEHNLNYKSDFKIAFEKFIESGDYILGKEVEEFEKNYSNYIGSRFAIGVSNCHDGLELLLKSVGVGIGDEVIVPSNTFLATWLAVLNMGAIPVPVEPQIENYNIDPQKLEFAITKKTKAIIVAHLYGLPCDMDAINKIAIKHSIYVFEDAAQSHGSKYKKKYTGNLSDGASFSFYPSKNIGALGDAGIVTTNSDEIFFKLKAMRNYGSLEKYKNEQIGRNSRLDEIQACFLNIKLKEIERENNIRKKLALRYISNLKDLKLPIKLPNSDNHLFESSWHLFVILLTQRDELKTFLLSKGIQTMYHYPIAPHKQKVFVNSDIYSLNLPISEKIHKECISLPISSMHNKDEIDYVCSHLISFFKK